MVGLSDMRVSLDLSRHSFSTSKTSGNVKTSNFKNEWYATIQSGPYAKEELLPKVSRYYSKTHTTHNTHARRQAVLCSRVLHHFEGHVLDLIVQCDRPALKRSPGSCRQRAAQGNTKNLKQDCHLRQGGTCGSQRAALCDWPLNHLALSL